MGISTLAVTIEGGGGGFLLDTFRVSAAAIQADSAALLQRLGLQGRELVSVVPVTTGKGSGFVRTEYAICFLRRARTHSVKAVVQGAPPKGAANSTEQDVIYSIKCGGDENVGA